MKKIISILTLIALSFSVTNAAGIPDEPMVIYGNISGINGGILKIKDSNNKLLKTVSIISSGKYGTTKTFDLENKISLNNFNGELKFSIDGYSHLSTNRGENDDCSYSATFQKAKVCQYNLKFIKNKGTYTKPPVKIKPVNNSDNKFENTENTNKEENYQSNGKLNNTRPNIEKSIEKIKKAFKSESSREDLINQLNLITKTYEDVKSEKKEKTDLMREMLKYKVMFKKRLTRDKFIRKAKLKRQNKTKNKQVSSNKNITTTKKVETKNNSRYYEVNVGSIKMSGDKNFTRTAAWLYKGDKLKKIEDISAYVAKVEVISSRDGYEGRIGYVGKRFIK